MVYDFKNLSPDDFQVLVRDLLQEELKVILETFTAGPDLGIDLRGGPKAKWIVQCKRVSAFSTLRAKVRKELPKLALLKPTRYFLASSAALNPQRKNALQELLRPFAELEDILGREDLNNYLTRHPNVERRHFKLWLDSIMNLDRVLNTGAFGEDDAAVDRAKVKLRRYVENPSLARAHELLDKDHYCIIAGPPGIGKTTLAEVLMLDHVKEKSFQLVTIQSSLEEIRKRRNPRDSIFFYFDDFLGQTFIESLPKNEDRRLIHFIEDVRANDNWRFVLTTREYIFNQAVQRFEHFARASEHLAKCVISLSDYTTLIRAKILYNHLYYSGLPAPYLEALLKDDEYLDVIQHRNYNPRLIEYMTTPLVVSNLSPEDYPLEFHKNFENPHRIWRHAFTRHITRQAQDLLLVLSTFSGSSLVKDIERSFASFHQRRSRSLQTAMSTTAFSDALGELDGDFLSTARVAADMLVDFSNPSVRDFLHAHLNADASAVADLVASSEFFEQLQVLWEVRHTHLLPEQFLQDTAEFEARLVALLESDSARFIRYSGRRGATERLERQKAAVSQRILTLMEVAEELGSETLSTVVGRLLSEDDEEQLDLAKLEKNGLVAVLSRLNRRTSWVPEKSALFKLTREFLLTSLEEPGDFLALAAFVGEFPLEFDLSVQERIERVFKLRLDDWNEEVWYDEDALWGLHSDLEELEQFISSVAKPATKALRERGEEFERENHESLYDKPKLSGGFKDNSADDVQQIRELFGSLL